MAWLTLTPRPPRPEHLPFACLVCGEVGGLDVANNLIMLLPLGAAVFLLGRGLPVAIALGLALSGAVEALQAVVVPGRDASLSDLITNTASAAMGWLLMRAAPVLLAPAPALARRLAVGWSVLATGLLGLGAAFVQPSTPPGDWYAQLAPRLGNLDVFTGRVLAASLAGRPFWRDVHPARDSLAGQLRAAPWTFEAVATGGGRTRRLAPIVSVYTGEQRKVVILGQRGTAVSFTPRVRSEDWRFRALALESRAGAIEPGDTVQVMGSFGAGRISVGAMREGRTATRSLALSPAMLWAFVTPVPAPLGRWRWAYTALWFGLLLGPIGWWTVGRPQLAAVLVATVMGIGLVAVPRAAGLPAPPPAEWLLALAAFALGRLGRRGVSRSG